uniref:Uncharacterized protein n=1 Tax=Octopus bimaculoides TaxID=37653 RepID=A0A0L8IIQ1_OCTBM
MILKVLFIFLQIHSLLVPYVGDQKYAYIIPSWNIRIAYLGKQINKIGKNRK